MALPAKSAPPATDYNALKARDTVFGPFPTADGKILQHHSVVLGVNTKTEMTTLLYTTSVKDNIGRTTASVFSKEDMRNAGWNKESSYRTGVIAEVHASELTKTGTITKATFGEIEKQVTKTMTQVAAMGTRPDLAAEKLTLTRLTREGEVFVKNPITSKETFVGDREHGPLGAKPRPELREVPKEPAHSPVSGKPAPVSAMSEVRKIEPVAMKLAGGTATEVKAVAQVVAKESLYGREVLSLGKTALRGLNPIGDAELVGRAAMGMVAFVDTHSGRSISEGPIGQAVGRIGESSGAFAAIYAAQQSAEKGIDRASVVLTDVGHKTGATAALNAAGKALEPGLAAAEHQIGKLANKLGFEAAVEKVGQLADKVGAKLDNAAVAHVPGYVSQREKAPVDQVAALQGAYNKALAEGGHPSQPLTRPEAEHLTKELAKLKHGEVLVVDKVGNIEVAQASSVPQKLPKDTFVLDGAALKEAAGMSPPSQAHAARQEAKADHSASQAAMTM